MSSVALLTAARWSPRPTHKLQVVTLYVVCGCAILDFNCLYHPYLFALFVKKYQQREKKKKSQEINSPKEAQWVIGSYVDARAVWPRRDMPAASSDPGWPR